MSKNKQPWTQEELGVWKKKKEELNAIYKEASEHQLEEWVKGNSIHNDKSCIVEVVNDAGEAIEYYVLEGPECCPDFSCCTGNGFSLEERKRFVDFIKNGNNEAKQHMLAGALNDLVITHTNERVHLAGQTIDLAH